MWEGVVASLVPTLIDIIKEAIIASKGNDEVARGILLGILGTSDRNEINIAIALAKAKIALALDAEVVSS